MGMHANSTAFMIVGPTIPRPLAGHSRSRTFHPDLSGLAVHGRKDTDRPYKVEASGSIEKIPQRGKTPILSVAEPFHPWPVQSCSGHEPRDDPVASGATMLTHDSHMKAHPPIRLNSPVQPCEKAGGCALQGSLAGFCGFSGKSCNSMAIVPRVQGGPGVR